MSFIAYQIKKLVVQRIMVKLYKVRLPLVHHLLRNRLFITVKRVCSQLNLYTEGFLNQRHLGVPVYGVVPTGRVGF